MSDGQVVFQITGDASHVNQTVKQVTNSIQSESKKWDQAVSDSTDKAGKSFLNWKTVAVGAATAIGAALIKVGQESIDAASDLAEVQNVVDTVFGDGARRIDDWAKKAGSAFGLSETMAKRFTSTLGAMMKSSGLAGDEIVGMSTDLAGLAADMASFYNLDFETAFEKIRSGISGQSMPLKQLGIDMSVANLNAFALAQGLEKTFEQMDQGEQTMLRYQYLMQATADAQGDFEKTADGFANSQRRIQSAVTALEAKLGQLLLPTIENVTNGIAGFLEKLTATPERTVLDDFNEIEVDTSGKMAELEKTYEKAQTIIALLDEIGKTTVTLNDGSTKSFADLFADLGNIEASGGNVREYIEGLGLDVDYVVQKYNVWKESTRQLTSLVPGLTSVIDSETGAIEGGTDALQKNLDEWRAYQEKKIAWAAYYAKERALAEKKGEMYVYEFDAGAARKALENQQKKLAELRKTMGFSEDYTGIIVHTGFGQTLSEDENIWNDAVYSLENLQKRAEEAQAELTRQTVDYSEAEEQLRLGKEALIEKYGEEEQAAEDAGEATEYAGRSAKEWVDSLKDAPKAVEAIKAVIDYYNGVRDATEQAVNSTLKGFESISKAGDDLRKKKEEVDSDLATSELKNAKLLESAGGFEKIAQMDAEAWKKLKPEVQDAYNEIAKLKNEQKELNESLNQYKPEGMKKNLQDQIKYMEEYLQNLNTLKEWGVSDQLIASLSDGSKESAEYLSGLVEGGKDAAQSVDELFGSVTEKKQTFIDALTQNKLAVDETYQDLVETMAQTIEALDFGEDAYNASAEDVQMIAAGIMDNVGEVEDAVSALLDALNPLSSIGYNWSFTGGTFTFDWPDIPGFATGLDYVPYNNFPAFLHEGEAVLTAEENRLWQTFKNQAPGMDYDTLGGVMRDSIQPGGNVYLDGRSVGKVISGIQGEQYRTLQRSGWQQ